MGFVLSSRLFIIIYLYIYIYFCFPFARLNGNFCAMIRVVIQFNSIQFAWHIHPVKMFILKWALLIGRSISRHPWLHLSFWFFLMRLFCFCFFFLLETETLNSLFITVKEKKRSRKGGREKNRHQKYDRGHYLK